MAVPNRDHVGRKRGSVLPAGWEVWLVLVHARAVCVGRVDKLSHVHKLHGRGRCTHQVFAPEVALGDTAVVGRTGLTADALHHDQKARAGSEDRVAESLSSLVPVRGPPTAPRGLHRLVDEISCEGVPVRAHQSGKNAPASDRLGFAHSAIIPHEISWPRRGSRLVHIHHNEKPPLSSLIHHEFKHVSVTQVDELGVHALIECSLVDLAVDEDRVVIQKQADGIEALLGDEVQQLVHRAVHQSSWHRIRGLAAPPVDALEVKALAVCMQEAVRAGLKAGSDSWI